MNGNLDIFLEAFLGDLNNLTDLADMGVKLEKKKRFWESNTLLTILIRKIQLKSNLTYMGR